MTTVRFDVTLHPLPDGVIGGPPLSDAWGTWPTIELPQEAAGLVMSGDFDAALGRLAALDRLYVEPDGSFVWVGPGGEGRWQVDGNAYERQGKVLNIEVKGACPEDVLDAFLAVWGWPDEPLAVQLVRAGVFVDVPTFRRHAAARGGLG